jgi:hypothetical protein
MDLFQLTKAFLKDLINQKKKSLAVQMSGSARIFQPGAHRSTLSVHWMLKMIPDP